MAATLESRLPLIAAELQPKVSAAVKAGAELIAQDAASKVALGPDPYHLRDDIHTERTGPAEYSVVAGGEHTFYGHMLEHGTTKMPARPFLMPAAEENADEVVALVEASLRAL